MQLRHFIGTKGRILLTSIMCTAFIAACGSISGTTPSSTTVATQADSSGASTTTTVPAQYKVGNFADGVAEELLAPSSSPPGSNIWSCVPTSAHPYPVVLVHGTFANSAFSWQALSPMLANQGYCVFALNYGQTIPGPIYGTGEISASAQTLSTFVNKVLASTGASKVDIIGHSQGGMMPRYYIQNLGGASKVNMMIGIAASNEGTTADGIGTLAGDLTKLIGISFSDLGCTACDEQEVGSTFVTNLDSQSGGGTSPGVKYVNIESKYDEVITPYKNAFLPAASNVQNLTLQDYCSTDFTEHIGIIYDPVTLALIVNALGPDSSTYKPPCSIVLPVIS